LQADFENLTFKDGERVDDFAMRINGVATQLRLLGDTVNDERIMQKFLRVVPSRFAQIATAIETLLDLHTLSIEELTGRLRVVEDRLDNGRESSGGGQLHLTEREWGVRKLQFHDGGASSSGGRGKGHAQRGGGNRGRKPGQPQQHG
jgi:hypothetical protein